MNDRHKTKPYPLRMPDEMRETLDAAANAESRSLHAEILLRLQQSIDESIPNNLRTRIKSAADKNKRSLTGEIVARLESSLMAPLEAGERPGSEEIMASLEKRLEAFFEANQLSFEKYLRMARAELKENRFNLDGDAD